MRYLIHASRHDGEDDELLWHKALDADDEKYLRESVLPLLEPLSDEEYALGPLAILRTAARWSYVLDGDDVLWCVEWQPGFLVIRLSPGGAMAWAAVRSPNPEFGGREATQEEIDAFDEDAPNPQYNLVFDAWDAQFDEDYRADWEVADEATERAFDAALSHANALGEATGRECATPEALDAWRREAEASRIWRGEAT